MSRLKSALFLSVLLLATPAFAQSWGSGNKVKMKDLIPKMSSDEGYSERYSFGIDLDGGGHIGMDFTISNLGWGDGAGATEVRVNLPGQKKYKFKKKKDEGDWSYSKNSFGLNIAGTSVKQKGNGFVLKHNGRVKVELELENKMPMWRPGSGIKVGDDGYYNFNLIAPRGDVTGRVKIGDTWYDVKATRNAYGEHTATNVAPYDMAKRISRFRDYENDIFVIWREIKLTEDYGEKSLGFVMVGFKDKIVFSDNKAKIKFAKKKKDSKTGYSIPYAVQVDGKKGGDSVRLVMNASTMKRKDMLASFGKAIKAVASAVSEPYEFRFKSGYKLQMKIGGTGATISGKSSYVVVNLNK